MRRRVWKTSLTTLYLLRATVCNSIVWKILQFCHSPFFLFIAYFDSQWVEFLPGGIFLFSKKREWNVTAGYKWAMACYLLLRYICLKEWNWMLLQTAIYPTALWLCNIVGLSCQSNVVKKYRFIYLVWHDIVSRL